MALVDNRRQRLCTLCALYVAQGIPWGFMTITLIAYLTSHGVGVQQAGELSALVLLPWTFKLIWAPLIDSATIRSMGRRRPWIIGAQLMMAVTLLGLLQIEDLTENLELLGWMFFLHNCFASLQDVCTDALAVDVLPAAEQGSANGLMWGSKLAGKGFGAAAMASVMYEWGFHAAVWMQFGMLLCIMLFPLLILERAGEKRFPWSRGQAGETGSISSVRSPVGVLKDLFVALSLRTTFVFAVFAVIKLVGSGVNEIVIKPLYTQQLNWHYVEFSKVMGLYTIVPNLLAAVLGGFLANRFGRRTIITFGAGGFGLVAIVFGTCPGLWNERWFATAYLLLSEGLLAVASVGFLSMAMRITWSAAAATMFTTYMTLSNVGHVIGNWLAGPIKEMLAYERTEWFINISAVIPMSQPVENVLAYQPIFWFIGIATFIPLALLLLVEPMQVDRFKYAKPPSSELVAK